MEPVGASAGRFTFKRSSREGDVNPPIKPLAELMLPDVATLVSLLLSEACRDTPNFTPRS